MNLISAENISRSYGDKTLFENCSLGLAEGDKVALVGINGSGKSSLLKIMSKIEEPDSGEVQFRKGLRIGVMDQEVHFSSKQDALTHVMASDYPEAKMLRDYERLTHSEQDSKSEKELSQLLNKLESTGAWNFENRAIGIMAKLSIPQRVPLSEFSGGQKRRLSLAMTLLGNPDLLILDEPTNHLDMEGIDWLEDELSRDKLSFLLITHDRHFLNRVCNRIIEIDEQKLFAYEGNYSYFIEHRELRKDVQKREASKAKSLLKTELEWLRRMPKARTTKSKSRIESVHRLIDKSKSFREEQQVRFGGLERRLGGKVLEFKKVSFSYPDKEILNGFNYSFRKGERLGITGGNGTGKSTFIKLITDEISPDMGHIQRGDTLRIGYYGQDGIKYKAGQRVIEWLREIAETSRSAEGSTIRIEDLLKHFLFDHAKQREFVEKLSGGEKRRLYLVSVLLQEPNLLLLDEPTNDLDIFTMNALEQYLSSFKGCLVVVSHDRFFMDKIIDHLFVFEGNGKIKDFPGSYSQYRLWKSEKELEKKEEAPPEKKEKAIAHANAKKERNSKKLSFKERQELETLETEIEELEEEKKDKVADLSSGKLSHVEMRDIGDRIQSIENLLLQKEERWLDLSTRDTEEQQ